MDDHGLLLCLDFCPNTLTHWTKLRNSVDWSEVSMAITATGVYLCNRLIQVGNHVTRRHVHDVVAGALCTHILMTVCTPSTWVLGTLPSMRRMYWFLSLRYTALYAFLRQLLPLDAYIIVDMGWADDIIGASRQITISLLDPLHFT